MNHRTDFLGEKIANAQIDSLQNVIETLAGEKDVIDARLAVLKEQDLLKANRQLNTESSTAQIAEQLILYEHHLGKMKTEEISLNTQKKKIDEHVARIVNQLNTLRDTKTESKGEIEVRISSEQTVTAELEITYLVANAGWYPKYDIRVANINSPLELTYRAAVYQRTGVDWKDVRLRFSNADPRQGATAVALTPWRLSYAQHTIIQSAGRGTRSYSGNQISGKIVDDYNDPIIGANVQIQGTSIGTITDINGYYTLSLSQGATHIVVSYVGYSSQVVPISAAVMDVRLMAGVALSEVTVLGARAAGATNYYIDGVSVSGAPGGIPQHEVPPLLTTMIENQTTVEIEVEIPYSMPSSPELLTIDLQKHEIEVSYEYFAVPKLEQHAYLIARATGWDRYNLLEGEANLYFEDAYVGRTIIDAKSMRDTLDISLGRDRNIVIGRVKNDEYK